MPMFSEVTWLFAGLLWLTVVATITIVWARRDTWVRHVAPVAMCLTAIYIMYVMMQTLGWHKPYHFADLTEGDHRVLAAKMVQDDAIYLYLDSIVREPLPLKLPWNNEVANRIQELIDKAHPDSQGQFMMRYEPSLDTHAPQFHPLPQPPALPPKPPQEVVPHYDL